MVLRAYVALAILSLALPVGAQTLTVPVQKVPADLIVSWDDDTPTESPATTYEVALDGGAPVIVQATQNPCLACAEVTITAQTLGLHTISVRGRNAVGVSDPALLDLTLTILVTAPPTPTRLRLVRSGIVVPMASVPGTRVPPSISLVAPDLSVWSLSAPLVNGDIVCPGALGIQCRAVVINGAAVPGGNAYELLIAADGAVWMHTYSGLWYRAGSSVGQMTAPQ